MKMILQSAMCSCETHSAPMDKQHYRKRNLVPVQQCTPGALYSITQPHY